jgi:hypothetical protein
MNKTFLIISLLYISSETHLQAQSLKDTSYMPDGIQLEKLVETATEDNDISAIAEDIEELEKNPIDLNTADLGDLLRIPLMGNLMASRIVLRRDSIRFDSVNELKEIEGVTSESFEYISRFVYVGNKENRLEINSSILSRVSSETVNRKGFKNGNYFGSPLKVLNKLRFSIGSENNPLSYLISVVKIGALAEKDPGEISMTNFTTGFLFLEMPALSSSLIIGDYSVKVAEGLAFWSSYGLSKGSSVIDPVRKNGFGFSPYLSSDENKYFRGLALSTGNEKMNVQLMYSNKSINGSIDSSGRISSIDKSGLFRTESELKHKKSSRENMVGYNAYYSFDELKIGCSGYKTEFIHPLYLTRLDNKSRNSLWLNSLNISYTKHDYEVFTEIAMDYLRSRAFVGGIVYLPSKYLSLAASIRDYPKSFQSIYGNAFGESGEGAKNQKGLYFGLRFQPIDGLWISSYYDQFKFPLTGQNVATSSTGNDFLALAEYKISKKTRMTFRFKQKNVPSAIDTYDAFGRLCGPIIPRIQQNYRLSLNHQLSSAINLTNKVEWTLINYEEKSKGGRGFLMSQSVKLMVVRSLIITGRITMHETDSYDSRIYDYEDDLPGTFSNSVLYGKGLRWFLLIRHHISSKIDYSAKYSESIKDGTKSFGTGNDEVIGDKQGNFSVQIEVRF